MKKNKKLTYVLTILVIILLYAISFIGIYVKKQQKMVNILPEYLVGMELEESRQVVLKPDETKETKIFDSEGNLIDEEDKDENIEYTEENGYKTIEEPINKEEVLNKNNFNQVKQIIEKRMKKMGITQYTIRVDEQNGQVVVNLPEDTKTDETIETIVSQGKFEMLDSETKEVLMDNNDIKSAKVLYNTTTSGTTIYLSIKFDKEGQKKLEEISKKYIETTVEVEATEEEEAHTDTVKKNVSINIDGQEFLNTYFGETIANGELSISVGSATTDSEQIQENISKVSTIATLLDNGVLPIVYTVQNNENIPATIDSATVEWIIYGFIIINIVILIYFIVKFKKNGIFLGITAIGFIAILLLVIRFTNVVLTIEGIATIGIITILNYIYLNYILKEQKNENVISELNKKCFIKAIPLYIISIIACFSSWLPIASCGMVLFWGFVIAIIYNWIITKFVW